MDFKDIQEKVIKTAFSYGKKYNIAINQDFALIKLYEEMGEVAEAVLIHQKRSRPEKYLPEAVSKNELAKELADVVGMIMLNAHLFEIDLEKAIQEKWIREENKKIT